MELIPILLFIIVLHSTGSGVAAIGICDDVISSDRPAREALLGRSGAAAKNDIESACLLLASGADVNAKGGV